MRNIALPTAGLIVIENNKLLENIEFHINVAKKYNKKEFKKGNQYHFSYETKCLFDDEELKYLEKNLIL